MARDRGRGKIANFLNWKWGSMTGDRGHRYCAKAVVGQVTAVEETMTGDMGSLLLLRVLLRDCCVCSVNTGKGASRKTWRQRGATTAACVREWICVDG